MSTPLEQKLADLKDRMMMMAGMAEEMISSSVKSLVTRDEALARRVIEVDEEKVNRLELEIEEAAIGLIALHQPEASNLRTLAMIIKVNNDLERLGDHAENIAEAALYLMERPSVKPLEDLPAMAEEAIGMVKDVLDAFARGDAELARSVCRRDEVVDQLRDRIVRELVQIMTTDGTAIDRGLRLMMVALNLERIADHSTNIAEDVIYMATGEVIKHRTGESGVHRPNS
ncbi:MAG: phosphate signaling complex protein PhoU [candidate division WOR-3 bacterium]